MKRHPTLIPISREHHQLLLLAQLLKKDAPPYQGLPQDTAGKKNYALTLFHSLIRAHLLRDRQLVYPFFLSFHADLSTLCEELSREVSQLEVAFQAIDSPENDLTEQHLPEQLDMLGRMLEAYVRKKERKLFELAQQVLEEGSFALLDEKLSE